MNDSPEVNQDLPCKDKLAFESEGMAVGSAAAIKFQRGTKLKAYKCSHCRLWHLASHFD